MNRNILIISAVAFFVKVINGSEMYSHYEFNEDVYVRHLAGRSRRASGDGPLPVLYTFPEKMTFKIHPNTKREVHLDLELNKRARGDYVPMVRSVGGVDTPVVHDQHKNYAFYHVLGKDASAAVMVECPESNAPCHLTGHYHDGQDQFAIEPDFSKGHALNSMPHKTYKVGQRSHNMSGDIDFISGSKSVDLGFLSALPKRQTNTLPVSILETLVLIDYTIYQYFLNVKGSVAAAELTMQRYYEQLMCMIDLRYQTLADVDFRIFPKKIKLMPNANDSPWLVQYKFSQSNREYLNCVSALDALHDWALANLNSLGQFDHLVSFTSIDLSTRSAQGYMENAGILGIANMKKDPATNYPVTLTCAHLDPANGNITASITEDLSDADTSLVAAHEIAHNLGVQHDGDYSSASCFMGQNQYYVMEATVKTMFTAAEKTHPWKFSSCSSLVIKYTLETLLSQNNGQTCMQTGSTSVADVDNKYNPLDYSSEFSFNNQCRMEYGTSSYRCSVAGEVETNICHAGIKCQTSMGCSGPLYVLNGSPCGGGTCDKGVCVGAPVVSNPPPPPPPPAGCTNQWVYYYGYGWYYVCV